MHNTSLQTFLVVFLGFNLIIFQTHRQVAAIWIFIDLNKMIFKIKQY